ncbi:hypothetical protein WA026_000480 [Henosepilachna vigintioctopunctata]|uniref:Uncharacterized protein n=1 Tax=Henosepilachna vigintioctopunctata TaxID=420089 RepID=A0AAW1V5Z3_9CUCU
MTNLANKCRNTFIPIIQEHNVNDTSPDGLGKPISKGQRLITVELKTKMDSLKDLISVDLKFTDMMEFCGKFVETFPADREKFAIKLYLSKTMDKTLFQETF